MRPKGVIGLFPANSSGDDIIVYDPNDAEKEIGRFYHLRQQKKHINDLPYLCLADFIEPASCGKKDYIGGIIAPGIDISLNTLSDKASLIPKIKLEKAKGIIGKNTISAIRSGFYHGYAGLIDNIIKMIIKQTGKSFNIILTGGYSYLFKNSIKKKIIIKKNLTINGVLKAAVFLSK